MWGLEFVWFDVWKHTGSESFSFSCLVALLRKEKMPPCTYKTSKAHFLTVPSRPCGGGGDCSITNQLGTSNNTKFYIIFPKNQTNYLKSIYYYSLNPFLIQKFFIIYLFIYCIPPTSSSPRLSCPSCLCHPPSSTLPPFLSRKGRPPMNVKQTGISSCSNT